ncbi:MAG: hypothetical protein ACPKNR_10010 [Pleomorphochaeta sp.]
MIKILEFLFLLLAIIIYIKYHKKIKDIILELNKSSRYSISVGITALLLNLFFSFLKNINYDLNIYPNLINVISSTINLFSIVYIPIIIIVEIIRKKLKKSNNIFKVIIIDMIFGEKILFNILFLVIFIGLYQFRYNISGITFSEGNSNIINTLQTIIVTFFISLNFSEGYKKHKEKEEWEEVRKQLLYVYKIMIIRIISLLEDDNFYTNFDNTKTLNKLFGQIDNKLNQFEKTYDFKIIHTIFKNYSKELINLLSIKNKTINLQKFSYFVNSISAEEETINFILNLIPNSNITRNTIAQFINLKVAINVIKSFFIQKNLSIETCNNDIYINNVIINFELKLINSLATIEF